MIPGKGISFTLGRQGPRLQIGTLKPFCENALRDLDLRSIHPNRPLAKENAMPSVPTLTCPYCRHTFVGVKVTRHGLMTCGKCGKTIKV